MNPNHIIGIAALALLLAACVVGVRSVENRIQVDAGA